VPSPQTAPANAAPSAAGKPPTTTPSEQPSPEDLLRQVADVYRKADSFQVDYSQTTNVEVLGQKQQMVSEMQIVARRPNRLAMRTKPGSQGVDVVSDGEDLYLSLGQFGQYSKSAAPATFDELLVSPQFTMLFVMSGGRGPLLELLAVDPFATIMEGVTSAKYVAKEAIDGEETHHLRFTQEFDWDLWVAANGEPLVRQMSADMGKAMAAAGQAMPGFGEMKMSSLQSYKNWKLDMEPAEDAFAFVPPAGAQEVADLFGGLVGQPGLAPPQGEEEQSSLVGEAAPDIEQKLLDGSEFSLKSMRGKQVVMLDFWATWCPPCVQEMPILAKVAAAYAEKGVALVCVNQQESADEVSAFLKAKKLDVTVCLDSDGAAGQAYGANAIPMLVLVDKEGIVRGVHVGYSPNIEATLKTELDTLLAGDDG
jgi:thiol-disulfide isomerase/thioredoxin